MTIIVTSFIQYCDKYIAKNYSGMIQKAEGCTVYNGVTIVSDTVTLAKGKATKCSMDKSEVSSHLHYNIIILVSLRNYEIIIIISELMMQELCI